MNRNLTTERAVAADQCHWIFQQHWNTAVHSVRGEQSSTRELWGSIPVCPSTRDYGGGLCHSLTRPDFSDRRGKDVDRTVDCTSPVRSFRFHVGGLTNVVEIKSHRKICGRVCCKYALPACSDVRVLPGKVIPALKRVGVEKLPILTNFVDEVGKGINGDPASAP